MSEGKIYTLPDGSRVEIRDEVYRETGTTIWVEHPVLGWIGIDREKLAAAISAALRSVRPEGGIN